MRRRGIGARCNFALLAVILACTAPTPSAHAQSQPPIQTMSVASQQAYTWSQGTTQIIQAEGSVVINLDHTRLSARQAVIWLTPLPGDIAGLQTADIVLLDDASLKQPNVTRRGPELYVSATVRDSVSIIADERLTRDQSATPPYQRAAALRPRPLSPNRAASPAPDLTPFPRPSPFPPTAPEAAQAPTPAEVKPGPSVRFEAPNIQITHTPEGTLAAIGSGGVLIFARGQGGELIELRAQNAVGFLPMTKLSQARGAERVHSIEEVMTAVYLEGDVRITYTPAASSGRGEQCLEAHRAYYEFTTDRAVLADVVIHATDPSIPLPVIVRAEMIRQLSHDDTQSEYRANRVVLTTSAFATPTYALAADKAYIHRVDSGDPDTGSRTTFSATNTTLDLFGVPFFYLPWTGGSVTDRGLPIRSFQLENSNRFGFGARTEWGLLETLGQTPPRELDLSYRADYFSKRGPAGGIDADYSGGFITETTRNPWNFTGTFNSYFIDDHGTDEFGGDRTDVTPPDPFRGQLLWQHQHFFPDDWQVQLRGAWVSDATFLEEWFPRQWQEGPPHDEEIYIKRQHDTEAYTFLAEWQPNQFVTTADFVQEQFEVERVPEFGYHRIGDSFGDDKFTFFSDNTVSRLHFEPSSATLAEQGYPPGLSPGIPSVGQTGTTSAYVYRGDMRQEIDYPLNAGKFKLVPYVFGRYIPYSDSPNNGALQRLFAAAGFRTTTAFWKVDNSARSGLLDINRLRHVVEPELNLFTSAQTVDRNDVFIYDEQVDAINDVQAAQVALHQRWQTKRGGPGRWRSVDVFSVNVEGNFFLNQPSPQDLEPTGFRGLYFPSIPEASIPRNGINADETWRISDTMVALADQEYNLDEQVLATASIGLAVERDPRLTYFVGQRYIEVLNSNILSLSMRYALSTKYALDLGQSFDFGQDSNVYSSFSVVRRFDRFFVTVTTSYDDITGVSGVSFNISPQGLRYGLGTPAAASLFQ